jgi:hypothetical protein
MNTYKTTDKRLVESVLTRRLANFFLSGLFRI